MISSALGILPWLTAIEVKHSEDGIKQVTVPRSASQSFSNSPEEYAKNFLLTVERKTGIRYTADLPFLLEAIEYDILAQEPNHLIEKRFLLFSGNQEVASNYEGIYTKRGEQESVFYLYQLKDPIRRIVLPKEKQSSLETFLKRSEEEIKAEGSVYETIQNAEIPRRTLLKRKDDKPVYSTTSQAFSCIIIKGNIAEYLSSLEQ